MTGLRLPGGGHRLLFEAARQDGAHDLMMQVVPPLTGGPEVEPTDRRRR